MCRYFNNFGRCKFEDSCSYLHNIDDKISEFRKEQEKDLKRIRHNVEEHQKQVEEMKN
jgi:hypothetical protein